MGFQPLSPWIPSPSSSRVSSFTGMMGKQKGAWDVLFPYMFGLGMPSTSWIPIKSSVSPCFCENVLQMKQIKFVFQVNKTNGLHPDMWRQVVCTWSTYYLLVLVSNFVHSSQPFWCTLSWTLLTRDFFIKRDLTSLGFQSLQLGGGRGENIMWKYVFQSCIWLKIKRPTWNRCIFLKN